MALYLKLRERYLPKETDGKREVFDDGVYSRQHLINPYTYVNFQQLEVSQVWPVGGSGYTPPADQISIGSYVWVRNIYVKITVRSNVTYVSPTYYSTFVPTWNFLLCKARPQDILRGDVRSVGFLSGLETYLDSEHYVGDHLIAEAEPEGDSTVAEFQVELYFPGPLKVYRGEVLYVKSATWLPGNVPGASVMIDHRSAGIMEITFDTRM